MIVLLALMVVVLLGRMSWRVWQRQREAVQTLESLKLRVETLKKQKEDLERKIQEVNEVDYLEKIGREELNLKKPGEKVVAFVQAPVVVSEKKSVPLSWWQKWLKSFQDWFAFKRQ